MCKTKNNICFVVGQKNKKIYFLGPKEIEETIKKDGSVEPDAHSVIRKFFRVSNTQNWMYDVENGVLECEDASIKHKDEVRKFIISMFKGKKIDQIRKLETLRKNVLVENEDNYKNTLLRLKTYKNVKIKGDICECCGNAI